MARLTFIGTLALLVACISTHAQGRLTLANRSTEHGIDSKVVLGGPTGTFLPQGSFWRAQLLQLMGQTTGIPIGEPVPFRTTPVAAGYLVPTIITVPGVAPGETATFQMMIFEGDSFTINNVVARSNSVQATLGDETNPAYLVGLRDISGVQNIIGWTNVPEPSTWAVLGLGGLVLLSKRRK